MFKHTPGPWRWWTSNSFRRLSSDATGKDGDVLSATVSRSDGHPDLIVSEADMKLIGAAPNLLTAAQQALVVLDCDESGDYHEWQGGRFAPATCPACALRAAISEATL